MADYMVECLAAVGLPGGAEWILIFFVSCFGILINAVWVFAFCKIYSRAGYSWAMGLLQLIPIVNMVMLVILAFSEWPIQKQVCQQQKPQL